MKPLLILAIVLSTTTVIAFAAVPVITANAHTGQPDNFCRFVDSARYGFVILCTFEPVVGEIALFPSGIHRTIINTETFQDGSRWVGFDCGHLADGTPILACSAVNYPYGVAGNN